MFTHNATESFDLISSKLSGSLLFTIVSNKEIKESLGLNEKGRFDHGAYSAIAFLMQFYHNGLIFSLPIEKQCAIELAAVAIYNHTRKYQVMDPKCNSNYYQPVFFQNPVSFLLRLCDDLQEWDRRYFEISKESNSPICNKCLMPSIHIDVNGKTEYHCACGKSKRSFKYINSFKESGFLNRKLYLVTTSNQMISKIVDVEDDKKALYFRIDYDLFKLLNIARINYTYAKYRLKELNEIKKLLKYQLFKTDTNRNLEFDYIYIDYFMTANPILIKVKILEKYICAHYLTQWETKHQIPYRELKKRLNALTGTSLCNQLSINPSSFLYKIISGAKKDYLFGFYKKLLKICLLARNESNGYDKHLNDLRTFIDAYTSTIDNNTMYCESLKGLIYDCYYQYSKETVIDENGNIPINFVKEGSSYYKQYQPESKTAEDLLGDCVNCYCRADQDFNRYDQFSKEYQNNFIGYFADLRLFELMNQDIQKEYLNRTFRK